MKRINVNIKMREIKRKIKLIIGLFVLCQFSLLNKNVLMSNPNGSMVLGYGEGTYACCLDSAGDAGSDLDVAFYVNKIHNQDLSDTVFSMNEVNFSAELNVAVSATSGYLKWYIDGVEMHAYQDTIMWTTVLTTGIYNIKMEVLLYDSTVKIVKSILNINIPIEVEICENKSILFETDILNGGLSPSYQWQKNGVDILGATQPTYTYTSPQEGDIISCLLTSNEDCAIQNAVMSNKFKIKVIHPLTPHFSFDTALAYCMNATPVELLRTSTNGITGTWSPEIISTAVAGTKTYTFTPDSNQCIIGDGKVTLTVTVTSDVVMVFGFSSALAYCKNAFPIALSKISSNGITGIWSPNEISTAILGETTYTFTPDTNQCVAGNDTITVKVTVTDNIIPSFNFGAILEYNVNATPITLPTTSNNGITGSWDSSAIFTGSAGIKTYIFTPNTNQCVLGDGKIMLTVIVYDDTPPMEVDICENKPITFKAKPVNGGSSPSFQWKKNGFNIVGATDSIYSYIPQNGDIISCELTSNANCVYPTTITSVIIIITVNPLPKITQPDSLIFCHGDSVSPISFTATDVDAVTWEVTSGVGTSIGMSANSGTGSIPGFTASNTTNSPITVDITVRAESTHGCKGISKIFTITVNNLPSPPAVTTPQTFCTYAEVANLQANGVGITWYSTQSGGSALLATHPLDSGVIYYAAQVVGICESTVRTAVKVFLDPTVVLEAPNIASHQSFCDNGNLTLADIATNGNTNIIWYNQSSGGDTLLLNTPLANGTSYYAAQTAGTCQSTARTAVFVTFGNTSPDSVIIDSPQYFCQGALIGNIAVPHNQIVWYAAKTGGDTLSRETMLSHGAIYYAAHKAGDCESEKRTPVLIYLTAFGKPEAPSPQSNCAGKKTLADLTIIGSGIVWYDAEIGGNVLLPTTSLVSGKTYYAAQTAVNCAGERLGIEIVETCFTLVGTVFPFVQTDDPTFNALFPITVRLYAVPSQKNISFLNTQQPLYTTQATFYNGETDFIAGTPKYPGALAITNNPGLPIDWKDISKLSENPDTTSLTPMDTIPIPADMMGKYEFKDIPMGNYLLVISRPGFLTRIGKIKVEAGKEYLGHREILAGDVDANYRINVTDVSNVRGRYQAEWGVHNEYNPLYDLDGNGEIDSSDIDYTYFNLGATFSIYREYKEWVLE